MNKKDRFSSEDYSPEKKESWFEHNQCQYTYKDKPCFMLGTSSSQGGSGGRYYCAYHSEVMHEESKANFQGIDVKDKVKFDKEHFGDWYKLYLSHGLFPDQFSGFYLDDGLNDPNKMPPHSKEKESEIWNKVNCGRGSW